MSCAVACVEMCLCVLFKDCCSLCFGKRQSSDDRFEGGDVGNNNLV